MSNSSIIPYGRQQITEEDIAEVVKVLRSDWLTQGPAVGEFEEAFATMCGAKHAVACANGTAALHLAMMAAGIGTGDRVITTPITFLASANAATYVGATPDFADIDPVSYCLCADALEAAWKPDTKAVVPVAFGGQSADLPRISHFARERGAVVIEDACHATGGRFIFNGKQHRVGGHEYADLTCFSFHPVKTITTGEGGMVTTNDDKLAEKLRLYRTHGVNREFAKFSGPLAPAEPSPFYYEMPEVGFNYRLTDFQAALGTSQLRRLEHAVTVRQQIVSAYNEAFADLPWLTTPKLGAWLGAFQPGLSWHLYVAQFDFAKLGRTREEVMAHLRSKGVGSQVHYIPVHLQPWYAQTFGWKPGSLPNAEHYYSRCLSLPLFADAAIIDPVVAAVRSLA